MWAGGRVDFPASVLFWFASPPASPHLTCFPVCIFLWAGPSNSRDAWATGQPINKPAQARSFRRFACPPSLPHFSLSVEDEFDEWWMDGVRVANTPSLTQSPPCVGLC